MKKNILEYLKDSVVKYPNKTCLGDQNGSLTFYELQGMSMKLAAKITRMVGDKTNMPIPVYLDKSINCIVSFLAIALSGNYYVPLDTKSPIERTKRILNILEAELIITDKTKAAKLKENEILLKKIDVEVLKKERDVNPSLFDSILAQKISTDPLYILFTSGTTGVPKGVVISHRSVIDYTEWLAQKFAFSEKTIFANQAPFYFDNSILDIYSTLKNGSTMWIIPEELFIFPKQLISYLKEQCINTIFWVPSALTFIANSGILDKLSQDQLPALEKILFCGEVMHNKQLNIWRKTFKNALCANLYGPTEITDVCSCYIVDREFKDSDPLPIGFACNNTDIFIINERNELVQNNEIGELCVRGECLSLGYYMNQQKTDEVFVQNPLNTKYRDLIFKTGDLAKYNPYGEILFLGRKDYQIKHMGHRIELGEIETVALSLEGMEHCCAIYDDDKNKIILVCLTENHNEKDIYQSIKEFLPVYMLPQLICIVDDMPLNANGKIDRKKLKSELIDQG